MIMEDIKRAVGELEQESSLPAVGVELVDNELATLYMNSKKSEVSCSPCTLLCFIPMFLFSLHRPLISPSFSASFVQIDFRDYPPLLRQAVSIARKIQDPLVEYAQVCSSDDDILCLKLHPLQVRNGTECTVFLTLSPKCILTSFTAFHVASPHLCPFILLLLRNMW